MSPRAKPTVVDLDRPKCISLREPCALLEYADRSDASSGLGIELAVSLNSDESSLRLAYKFHRVRGASVRGKRPQFRWLDRCPFCGVELPEIKLDKETTSEEEDRG